MNGLSLIGFGIWSRRPGGGRNVTFPGRQYSVNGERRSFALLRPANGNLASQEAVRELILAAYAEHTPRTPNRQLPDGATGAPTFRMTSARAPAPAT